MDPPRLVQSPWGDLLMTDDRVPPYDDRVPPHSHDAERAVLGALLVQSDRLMDVAEALQPADFYRTAHRTIYGALVQLAERLPQSTVLGASRASSRRGLRVLSTTR